MYRSQKVAKKYRHKHDQPQVCPFCQLDGRPVHHDGVTSMVVPNNYPYAFWDNRAVVEHLMLVPKRHVASFDELRADEKLEIMDLLARYEAAGYNIYWRSQGNSSRSVPHQHTHLIKVNNKPVHWVFYCRRPYLSWHG